MPIEWSLNQEDIDTMGDEIELKLAHLIINNVIFCNNGWFYGEQSIPWKTDAISLHVNCNDLFAWGCADSEDITFSELSELYDMWRKDPDYGTDIWCIKKRKKMPQAPVEKMIREAGVWDLDCMNLERNPTS